MIQEIEQIKGAEREAVLMIEVAKKKADHLIQQAREDATIHLENRKKEAECEVKKIRDNSLVQARILSIEISDKTAHEVAELLAEGEIRIPDAVNIIVKRAIGGSDVLSGTNG